MYVHKREAETVSCWPHMVKKVVLILLYAWYLHDNVYVYGYCITSHSWADPLCCPGNHCWTITHTYPFPYLRTFLCTFCMWLVTLTVTMIRVMLLVNWLRILGFLANVLHTHVQISISGLLFLWDFSSLYDVTLCIYLSICLSICLWEVLSKPGILATDDIHMRTHITTHSTRARTYTPTHAT